MCDIPQLRKFDRICPAIQELAKHDPTVHNMISHYLHGDMSYEKMLENSVVILVEQKNAAFAELLKEKQEQMFFVDKLGKVHKVKDKE